MVKYVPREIKFLAINKFECLVFDYKKSQSPNELISHRFMQEGNHSHNKIIKGER